VSRLRTLGLITSNSRVAASWRSVRPRPPGPCARPRTTATSGSWHRSCVSDANARAAGMSASRAPRSSSVFHVLIGWPIRRPPTVSGYLAQLLTAIGLTPRPHSSVLSKTPAGEKNIPDGEANRPPFLALSYRQSMEIAVTLPTGAASPAAKVEEKSK
jgi:hypothetical protein